MACIQRKFARNASSCDTPMPAIVSPCYYPLPSVAAGAALAATAADSDLSVDLTPGRFVFRLDADYPSYATMTARFKPTLGDVSTSFTLDLTDAFLRGSGIASVELQGNSTYDLELVNGNNSNPIRLANQTVGEFVFSNDLKITNLVNGIRYSTKQHMTPTIDTIDNKRQRTLAFTAAYHPCSKAELSVDTDASPQGPPTTTEVSVREFMNNLVPVM